MIKRLLELFLDIGPQYQENVRVCYLRTSTPKLFADLQQRKEPRICGFAIGGLLATSGLIRGQKC
jgi:hypothetical protein